MASSFRCTIVTPEAQLLDDEVTYASIPGWDGQVGLMHQRAPLLVKLGDGALRLDYASGGSRWFYVGGGFAQMKDDRLTVLTQEAVGVEEMVRQDVQATLKEAQARVAPTLDEVDRRRREISRAQTMLHLIDGHGPKG